MLQRLSALLVVTLLVGTVVSAQTFKIGVVNAEVILKELPEALAASKTIEETGLKVRDTLQMMQKEFESRIENYRKQEAMMTADGKRKEEESLNALRTRFLQYQEEKLGNTGEIARMRESLLQPIRVKVNDAIAAVAKEEKINLVLDKVAGLVLYHEDKADITYKVLDKMKRGNN
ncbi:MAG: OmpH family outer membrane protein [Ignavibacteria bacterium]|nr:OmpH family outer membrane protein [Ignavibacteria bacterium]MBP6509153.1 OmpH family outer membrane protein [Candidatus Kapabacteria bacterium]MBK6418790.1 OmpH family outer membrane protein [Ignavibacteria bacterium]MBK6760640.1 OmpH family outer membrane protein [Ignavibacteria bacterium]MBK7032606.1 OmpH family outer membrane protein [Ignavibacteria bacterium]